ncbi:MAG: hypothetical protein JW789_04795 [Candidatus Aenigmarchaeota archaeon]|nr:hypothetical protein [Candidatus Aenigmarchaeota archaeon]
MLGWILLAIGIAGFGYGGWKDLKTTEFHDWLPYSMIIAALAVRGIFSYITGDLSIITGSVFYGLLFLGFGYLLYFARQWGDGDAWLMGALGFLFPDSAGFIPPLTDIMPFPFVLVFNFFLLSLLYLIGYAFILGMMKPHVVRTFRKNLKSRIKAIYAIFISTGIASVAVPLYMSYTYSVPLESFAGIFTIPFIGLFMMFFFQYARAVENDLFKRKIKAKDLHEGDVIITDKWRGITEKEVKELKIKGGDVWIKEGVRFAPVFILTLLFTVFVGSLTVILFPL